MTREKINKCFESALGQQLDSLFATLDDAVFIRHEEAVQHSIKNIPVSLAFGPSLGIHEWFREAQRDPSVFEAICKIKTKETIFFCTPSSVDSAIRAAGPKSVIIVTPGRSMSLTVDQSGPTIIDIP